MGKFKRLCIFIFVFIGLSNTVAFAAVWFSWKPLLFAVEYLINLSWFSPIAAIFISIAAAGLLIILVTTVLKPSKHTQLVVKRNDGNIAIAQNAIRSTVKHVVEDQYHMKINRIKIRITGSREPHINISAKIDPCRNAELNQIGAALQDKISASVKAFTGNPVASVHITFVGNAEIVTSTFTQQAIAHTPTVPHSPKVRVLPTQTSEEESL